MVQVDLITGFLGAGKTTFLRSKSNGLAAGKIKMQRELLHIIWCGSFLFVRSAYP